MNSHTSTDRLAELLCLKLRVLEQVLTISQSQLDFVQRDEVDSLMELLAAKQVLLDQMRDLQTELTTFRTEDPDKRVWHSPQRREQTQRVAARCEAVLEEIMQLEKESERQLVVQRDAVAADLKAADRAEFARDAYSTASAPFSSGFEITSDA